MSTNIRTSSRLIVYKELKPVKGIRYSRMHLRRLMMADQFPQAVRVSDHYIAWYEHELDAWIAEKAAARAGGRS